LTARGLRQGVNPGTHRTATSPQHPFPTMRVEHGSAPFHTEQECLASCTERSVAWANFQGQDPLMQLASSHPRLVRNQVAARCAARVASPAPDSRLV
jgi:hypothetical protein